MQGDDHGSKSKDPPPPRQEQWVIESSVFPSSANTNNSSSVAATATATSTRPPRHNRTISWATDARGNSSSGSRDADSSSKSPVRTTPLEAEETSTTGNNDDSHQQQQQHRPNQLRHRRPALRSAMSQQNMAFLDRLHRQLGDGTTANNNNDTTSSMGRSSRRLLNLNDVLGSGPMELEAETRILRACEKLQLGSSDLTNSTDNRNNDNVDPDAVETTATWMTAMDPEDEVLLPAGNESEDDGEDSECDDDDDNASLEEHEGGDMFDLPPLPLDCQPNRNVGSTAPRAADFILDPSLIIPMGGPSLEQPQSSSMATTTSVTSHYNTNSNTSSATSSTMNARSRFRALVRQEMVRSHVQETFLGLSSTLQQMDQDQQDEEKRRRAQHHRITSQLNGQALGAFAATVNNLAGHVNMGNSSSDGFDSSQLLPGIVATPSFTSDSSGDEGPTTTGADNKTSAADNGKEQPSSSQSDDTMKTKKKKRLSKWQRRRKGTAVTLKGDVKLFQNFLSSGKARVRQYVRRTILYGMIPALIAAFILYYFVENPAICKEAVAKTIAAANKIKKDAAANKAKTTEIVCAEQEASISWWCLFLVRQLVTLTMALATQAFVVDFLALGTRLFLRVLGPLLTLFIVKSKGW